MRALALDLVHLRLLNEALDRQLHPVLERIVRMGAEPELIAIRTRVAPGCSSRWRLRAEGGGIARELAVEPTNVVALGLCAQCWLIDVTDELKRDLASTLHGAEVELFDSRLPWPRRPPGDMS